MSNNTIELFSSELCPFAQRTAITLLEKKIDFTITFIDLNNKPASFLAISPLGKVPLLRIGKEVLFESAIINEYLDETHPPSMHPKDPLERAKQRAWIEFASGIFMLHHQMVLAKTETELEEKKAECAKKLAQLEKELHHSPYFNGNQFCLVDIGFASGFLRLDALDKLYPLNLYQQCPKVAAWAKALVDRDSVKKSTIPHFTQKYRDFVKAKAGFIAGKI